VLGGLEGPELLDPEEPEPEFDPEPEIPEPLRRPDEPEPELESSGKPKSLEPDPEFEDPEPEFEEPEPELESSSTESSTPESFLPLLLPPDEDEPRPRFE